MEDYIQQDLELPGIDRRKLTVEFSGGDITSDGGCLLLRQVDQNLDLMKQIASVIEDIRKQPYVTHSLERLLRQRVFAIALGYEDVNDHTTLRNDPALQVAVGELGTLASSSTLGRLERKASREMAFGIHEKIIEAFIASFSAPPEELILDFDATDTEIHGAQVGRFFH